MVCTINNTLNLRLQDVETQVVRNQQENKVLIVPRVKHKRCMRKGFKILPTVVFGRFGGSVALRQTGRWAAIV